jgi:hypothetical protein
LLVEGVEVGRSDRDGLDDDLVAQLGRFISASTLPATVEVLVLLVWATVWSS